ncbi:hypothetical protein DAPPUDRAFT_247272 [Daphnia pulex]|uniref:Uncharacterized protein n=1 Tax=Daphnia pulex TaxID=6669 RepID=E9GS48_DAPPU|nr:hypothetical protein DAPPUDRAFT_247272 [Daphnia pulex]|eukprot:EFX77729.1 hypothetical protein DAPPUDRAFT_247272 [Daphnia pulex]
MRYEGAGLTVVFVLTFFVGLPVLCGTWPYSAYYRGEGVGSSSSSADDDSSALAYLSQVETAQQQPEEEEDGRRPFLLVTIVTVRREGQFYLSRVVARLHQLLSKYNNEQHAGNDDTIVIRAMICNVNDDPQLHREALHLQRIFPLVQRRDQLSVAIHNLMDKEKEDYVFCLNASRRSAADYILILEDDAVPHDDLLPVTRRFIDYFNQQRPRRRADFFYVKLYHPERLQNYLQPEPWRIAEWLAVSVLSVYLLQVVFRFRLRRHSFWLVYFMALVECLGRPHLLQLKRWMLARLVADPAAGYNLLQATECCTPAMLFSNTSAATASAFLSSITCRKGYAKDTALYLHSRQSGGRLQSFVVEPNLVQHIGRVSTLRRNH